MSWEEAVVWARTQPEQSDLAKACFFDDPLLGAADRYYASTEWQAIRAVLPGQPGDALEIGAGRGIASCALTRDGWRTTALEPDPSGIVGAGAIRQLAEAAGLPIRVEQSWGERLPFEAESFDLLFCRAVLHHAADLPQLCAEVFRVLKPGGTFLAVREHVISTSEDLPHFLAAHPLHRFYHGENAYLLDQYLAAIRSAGMECVRIFNPYESDINLYPSTRFDLKTRIAGKLKFVRPTLIPDLALRILGDRDQTPGRLFSFLSRKP